MPRTTLTLLEARERRGWTQQQLEDRSGVDRTWIAKLEQDETSNPSLHVVRDLEKALRLPPGSLVFPPRAERRRRRPGSPADQAQSV